jgi:hypothetical protein
VTLLYTLTDLIQFSITQLRESYALEENDRVRQCQGRLENPEISMRQKTAMSAYINAHFALILSSQDMTGLDMKNHFIWPLRGGRAFHLDRHSLIRQDEHNVRFARSKARTTPTCDPTRFTNAQGNPFTLGTFAEKTICANIPAWSMACRRWHHR